MPFKYTIALSVAALSIPAQASAQEFAPQAIVRELNNIVAVLTSDTPAWQDYGSVAHSACQLANIAIDTELVDNFQRTFADYDVSEEDMKDAAGAADFHKVEVERFLEYGASEKTTSVLSAELDDTRAVSTAYVSDPTAASALLHDYRTLACALASEDRPVEELKPELQLLGQSKTLDLPEWEDAGHNLVALAGIQDDYQAALSGGRVETPASDGGADTARALRLGALGVAAIVVDAAATLKSGGMAAAMIGMASAGWGWNRVEESYGSLVGDSN